LLELLWNERYLTRAQLIARVEQKLGKNCFGKAVWADNFYRDMRVVKQAFSAAEVDPRQIEIYHRLTPADRFRQGCAISDTARRVVAYPILQENPGISPAEANRMALKRACAQ
jgi:hypothetical protein